MESTSNTRTESPEQLLAVFKAAALSVTKLYKTSAAAESRARAEGYQECLDDLFTLLEKDATGLGDQAVSKLRRWIGERRDGRDAVLQNGESDEEADKAEVSPPPRESSDTVNSQTPLHQKLEAASANITTATSAPPPTTHFVVPSQDTFSFQSSYPNIATLDLSESRNQDAPHHPTRPGRRFVNNGTRPRAQGPLGRGAGTKRRIDFNDFFGNYFGGKDPSGGGNKRSRHN